MRRTYALVYDHLINGCKIVKCTCGLGSSFASLQTLMLYLVGSVERAPSPSPLIRAPKLDVDKVLVGARLMSGSKSEICAQECFQACKTQAAYY